MSQKAHLKNMVIAVALTEFASQYEQTDPELSEYAEHLADKHLVMHDSD